MQTKISQLQDAYPDPDHVMLVEDRTGNNYKIRLNQIVPSKEETDLRENHPTVRYYWGKYRMALKLAMEQNGTE